jgi:hypothetical protein
MDISPGTSSNMLANTCDRCRRATHTTVPYFQACLLLTRTVSWPGPVALRTALWATRMSNDLRVAYEGLYRIAVC